MTGEDKAVHQCCPANRSRPSGTGQAGLGTARRGQAGEGPDGGAREYKGTPRKPPPRGRGRRPLRGAGSGAATRPVGERTHPRLPAQERRPDCETSPRPGAASPPAAGELRPHRSQRPTPNNSGAGEQEERGREEGREGERGRPLSPLQPSRSPRREAAAARPSPARRRVRAARAPPVPAAPTWPPAPLPPPGGGSLSPSPPGGPAAHRVAIISFPVTKEEQILWSPHRGRGGRERGNQRQSHSRTPGATRPAQPRRRRSGGGPFTQLP